MSSVFGTTQTTFKSWIWLLLSFPNYLWTQLCRATAEWMQLPRYSWHRQPWPRTTFEFVCRITPMFSDTLVDSADWATVSIAFFWRHFSEPVIKAKLRMWWTGYIQFSVYSQSEQLVLIGLNGFSIVFPPSISLTTDQNNTQQRAHQFLSVVVSLVFSYQISWVKSSRIIFPKLCNTLFL